MIPNFELKYDDIKDFDVEHLKVVFNHLDRDELFNLIKRLFELCVKFEEHLKTQDALINLYKKRHPEDFL